MSFLAYISNLQRFGIRPGLERIRALLESADNPHRNYPHLLIGGTNGKGSTCEFIARALAGKSRPIGLYTSPHLYNWNERIRVLPGAGLFEGAISDAELDALFDDARPHIEAVAARWGQPTEFEVVTFLGLWHFARQNVAGAVLEVGLGGTWDATNVTNPLASCVTHVALDHTDRLGETREEIAADKVGIARAGRAFFTAETRPATLAVLRNGCARIGANFHPVSIAQSDFQARNAALAREVAAHFAREVGWRETNDAGENRRVAGRFETISHAPTVIIDGANNPDGALVVADEVARRGIARDDLVLVLGILADKNWREMTQILAPLARCVIATRSDSPRAVDAGEIAAVARGFCSHVETIVPVSAALERARTLAQARGTILVTGSFTTIAHVPRDENFEKKP